MESPGALKRKRKDLTLAAKMQVIQMAEMKISQVAISRSLGCSQSQISRLLSRKNDILQEYLANKNPFRKRKRFGKALDVEEALAAWFTEVTNKGVQVSTQILLAKAKELALQLDKPDFKPSNGWLSRWKLRNLVSLQRNKNDEKVYEKEAVERWMDHMFPMLMQEYNTRDVFCVAETEIYHKPNLNGDQASYEDDINDVIDKLNVLIACNATGLDKRPLFVVGQSELEPNGDGTLPAGTQYTSKENKITSALFTEWLNRLDDEMGKNGRKIALVLDDCPPHPRNDSVSLSNVMLVFNSPQGEPDCSINPCQNGIISTLTALFNEQLLARSNTENITLSDTVTTLCEAWEAMLPDTISKSFMEAGFKLPMVDKQKSAIAVTREQEKLSQEIGGRQNMLNIIPNMDPDQPTIKVEVDLDDDYLTSSYNHSPSPVTTEPCSSRKSDVTSLHTSYRTSTSTSMVTGTASGSPSKGSKNFAQVMTPKTDNVDRRQMCNEEPPTKRHKTSQSITCNTKAKSPTPETNQQAGSYHDDDQDDGQTAGHCSETKNVCHNKSSNDKQPATNKSSSKRRASGDGRSRPTNTEVMRALTTVRRYMEMNGGTSEHFYALEDHIMDLMEQNPE